MTRQLKSRELKEKQLGKRKQSEQFSLAANPSSREEKNLEREYPEALLSSTSTEKKRVLEEIARKEDVNFLRAAFSFPGCLTSKEEYDRCIYLLFLLFADKGFAKKDYSLEVFNWLAECGVEKIIEQEDQMKMIHWLVSCNNRWGVEWAFEWYKAKGYELTEIFKTRNEYGEDIFNYAMDVIIIEEKSSLTPQLGVLKLVLEKFKETVSEERKEEEIKEKKNFIRAELEAETYLTGNLEEQLRAF